MITARVTIFNKQTKQYSRASKLVSNTAEALQYANKLLGVSKHLEISSIQLTKPNNKLINGGF